MLVILNDYVSPIPHHYTYTPYKQYLDNDFSFYCVIAINHILIIVIRDDILHFQSLYIQSNHSLREKKINYLHLTMWHATI